MVEKRRKIVVVGGGKMGEAIVRGWIASSIMPAASIGAGDIAVVEPSRERRAQLERELGVACLASASDVPYAADIVVLAVKPQVMMKVLEEISSNPAFGSDVLFVSIAAGLTTAALSAGLSPDAAVVRVMPNLPLAIGAGASGVCAGDKATSEQTRYVADLFGCLGRAVVVDESDMDIVCALSGSGPAYVAAMVESLRDAAARAGLEAGLAEALALQTVLGTARLIDEAGADVAQTRVAVCSPGGTTLAALDAMYAAGFDSVFDAGVKAAIARSKELAQCT